IASITLDHGLLTALTEQWHSESQCYRIPTREMTMTLEDMWQILCMPILGSLIEYTSDLGWIREVVSALFDRDNISHD
ncbi:hypothetical protein KI387_044716, partial [Taxus chinensis]